MINRFDSTRNFLPAVLNIPRYTGMSAETLEEKMLQHRASLHQQFLAQSNGTAAKDKNLQTQRRKKRTLRVEQRTRRASRWESHMESFAQHQLDQDKQQRETKFQVREAGVRHNDCAVLVGIHGTDERRRALSRCRKRH